MADRQIPELPSATTLNTTDLLHLRQGDTDKKIDITTFQNNISSVANIQEDVFSGNGTQTVFTLTSVISSAQSLWVVIGGVPQSAANYTVLTNQITFTTAPPTGTDNIFIRNAIPGNIVTPADGSVTQTKMDATLDLEYRAIRKNLVIGGDFHTNPWQRGTSFPAISSSDYFADRFRYDKVGTMVHTASKAADAPTVLEAGIYTENCTLLDCTTADAAIAAGDLSLVTHKIEGYDWAKIAQRKFTLSFWHKHTKTGIYCVSFQNAGGDRSFVAEYTQTATDTWEKAEIVVEASPSTGTWDYTNGTGIGIIFTMAVGTTFHTTAGAWQVGNFFGTANQVNACDDVNNNFRLALVQVESGTEATAFEERSFAEELAFAKRYTQLINFGQFDALGSFVWNRGASNLVETTFDFPEMRTTPTITNTSTSGNMTNRGNGLLILALSGITPGATTNKRGAMVLVDSSQAAGFSASMEPVSGASISFNLDAEL